MKIGIFSKLEMAGGSEFRCAEMANGFARFAGCHVKILSENGIPKRIKEYLDKSVSIIENVFEKIDNDYSKVKEFYDLDCLLIVNTDCKSFTGLDFWNGKSDRHGAVVDLTKIRKMIFLFNFLVSPSRHLITLSQYCSDIRIITTNSKFFNEISSQDRYESIRHFPRIILQSPINPELLSSTKKESSRIRIGMHSRGQDDKWNSDWEKIIKKCNERIQDKISFDFMGISNSLLSKVKDIPNVICRKENSITVKEFLTGLDIFAFLPSWSREEPWARVVAEAMTSACPVITTKKGGNMDQIIQGHNGFLCDNIDCVFKNIVYLVEHNDMRNVMAKNAFRLSKNFTTEKVISKFIEFVEA